MSDDHDPAALAFDGLRNRIERQGKEIALLRRAIEGLAAARAEVPELPDYSETLGLIANNITAAAHRVDALVKSPALSLTPEELNRQILTAGNARLNEDRRAIGAAWQTIEQVATRLDRQLKSHVMADEQRRRLWQVGFTGLAAGMLLWVLFAGPIVHVLPVSWLLPERMAARALRMSMWEGGQRLMKAGDPQAFAGVLAGNRLATANRDVLEACHRQAAKAGKSVRCTIEVGSGE